MDCRNREKRTKSRLWNSRDRKPRFGGPRSVCALNKYILPTAPPVPEGKGKTLDRLPAEIQKQLVLRQ
jgi:hypothetical protein